ncbi:MAG TPA: M1 family aminopeptidase [Candidatus Acidoferrum sp.]|nr:M1 family aminopeptidase [Candidatus Acidoferrum sp.]
MKRLLSGFVALVCCLDATANELVCAFHSAGFAPAAPDSPDYRKYAPDREIDIAHLALDVTPHFKTRTVSGSATWTFKPIAKPLAELKLDAVELTITSVTSTEKVSAYQITADKVVVTFAEPIPAGKEASVTLRYSAQPAKGLYFRTPELGFKPEDMHIWTQGEPDEARHWYPCYDFPNEKFTCEITCHVPEGIVVLSNGKQVSETKDDAGLVAVRWVQDKPMVNYLVALVAGKLKSIKAKHRDIPMRFWTPATEIANAENSFRDTKPCMEFFEKEIGVLYPWDKYDQVCIQDYHWGGMENTSLTTLNINTLFPPIYENVRSSQGLVAHELAHQWFGDLVTCKDWSHIWLNEGFATFYDLLFTEHKDGKDEFFYRLWEGQKALLAQTNMAKSIVWRKFNDPKEQFDGFAYGKGSYVLQMLRQQLGPELFRACVKTYVERHKFGSVVTDDLREVIEELSGRSFDQFFDQWVYHAGFPVLDVDYAWDEKTKLAKISVRQTQPVNENVVLFNFPLPVRFKTKSGATIERTLQVTQKSEDFYVPLTEQAQIVRIDPALSVLAKINYRPATVMLHAMLADKTDVVGRFLACEQLGERKDQASITKLKETLNKDGYWGVRVKASQALRAMNSDDSFAALTNATEQKDARMRKQLVTDVTAFFRPEAFDRALAVVQAEKNPDIVGVALRALDASNNTNARAALLRHLAADSWRQHLAETAITAMRAKDDPSFIEPIREVLSRKGNEFSGRGGFANVVNSLAFLAREQENKDSVRELLLGFANNPRESTRVGAIIALGTLRDERALPALERFASIAKNSPESAAAEKSIEAIRTDRKSSAEVGALRRELLELQKQSRDLRKEFDTLKSKLDATAKPVKK